MRIEDCLGHSTDLPGPSFPVLTAFDALWDSILVDLRMDLLFNRCAVLIQGTGMPAEYNTGVLMLSGIEEIQVNWPQAASRTLRTIHLWKPTFGRGRWSIEIATERGGSFMAKCTRSEMILGWTEAGELVIPDLDAESDQEVVARTVSWQSEFTPLAREVFDSTAV